MSRPRHLWSGDWENDSAAVTEELGRRRQEIGAPAEPRLPEPPPPAGPSVAARVLLWLRRQWSLLLERWHARRKRARERERPTPVRTRRVRVALVAGLIGLLSAAIAFGVVLLLVSSDGRPASSSARSSRPWLGVDLESTPLGSGVLVADVLPGSPAQAAGLQPGDMITAIDGNPVSSVSGVSAALSGLHVGSQVEVQYALGLAIAGTYTVRVTLAAEPPGYP